MSKDALSTSDGSRVPVPVTGLRTRVKGLTFTVGLIVSRTVTNELQVAEFNEASFPVKVTETGAPISEQLNTDLLIVRAIGEQLSAYPLSISAGFKVAFPVAST